MFCPNCGFDCKDNNFCPKCGQDLRNMQEKEKDPQKQGEQQKTTERKVMTELTYAPTRSSSTGTKYAHINSLSSTIESPKYIITLILLSIIPIIEAIAADKVDSNTNYAVLYYIVGDIIGLTPAYGLGLVAKFFIAVSLWVVFIDYKSSNRVRPPYFRVIFVMMILYIISCAIGIVSYPTTIIEKLLYTNLKRLSTIPVLIILGAIIRVFETVISGFAVNLVRKLANDKEVYSIGGASFLSGALQCFGWFCIAFAGFYLVSSIDNEWPIIPVIYIVLAGIVCILFGKMIKDNL